MTTANYNKVFNQLKAKPVKLRKYIKHNAPKKRSCGKTTQSCRICGRHQGHISSYGINMCRQCFRDFALKIGFKKFN